MAADTAAKRFSAINISSPWRGLNVVPDGAVPQGERQSVMFMYSGILAGEAVTPTAPDSTFYSGGFPAYLGRRRRKDEEEDERIRIDRVRFGIIPDSVPQKAVEIIEEEVARQLATLDREEAEQTESLKAAFHAERLRWKQSYATYYKEYLDALVTAEIRQRVRRERRKRLMVFVLMNS